LFHVLFTLPSMGKGAVASIGVHKVLYALYRSHPQQQDTEGHCLRSSTNPAPFRSEYPAPICLRPARSCLWWRPSTCYHSSLFLLSNFV
jgi:hypothetical protein